MFETLEEKFEKSKPPLDRGYPILVYSSYAVVSFIALVLGRRGHGFSQLFSLAVWAAMFLLSFSWLVASVRSSVPITRHELWVRSQILLFLLFAQDTLPYILKGA
jgi:hypothetical protein